MTTRRAILVWSLVGVATLLTFVSSLTLWSKRQLLDTDAWTEASTNLLAHEDIQASLSRKLVDLVYARVDVPAQLAEALPDAAAGAAPALAGVLRAGAVRVVEDFLATPQAQTLWENANRRAHSTLIAVLEGEDVGPLSTAGGAVTLDLRPMIAEVATRLGLEDRLPENPSPTAGQIVLVESDQLDAAQTALTVFRALTVFLTLVVLALFVVAVYLARGRRRTVLQVIGLSLFTVGLLVLVVRRLVGEALVGAIASTEAGEPAVRAVWLIETDLLRDIGIALISYGVFAVLAGVLGGSSRPATAIRRALAPTFRTRPAIVYAVAAAVFLALVAWSPLASDRRLFGILVLAALVAVGIEAWRRETLREFPEPDAVEPEARALPPPADSPA